MFTTNPGLEDVAAEEVSERTAARGRPEIALRPCGVAGRLLLTHPAPLAQLWPAVQALRSVYHVLRPIGSFALGTARPMRDLRERLAQLPIADLEAGPSFRVTSRRIGDHCFTRMDVQREAGAVLQQRYGCRVDLEGFEANVRVDVVQQTCLVGIQLTRASLAERHVRPYLSRAALQPVVAWALLRLSGFAGRGALLDPFCGSGTVLLEAAAAHASAELYGSDLRRSVVAGAARNLAAAGVADRVELRCGDARTLSRVWSGPFRAIVTNPPYGRRVGRQLNFFRFYQAFLHHAARLLEPHGRLALLVFKRGAFEAALRSAGRFRLLEVRCIEAGGLHPHLHVLEADAAVVPPRGERRNATAA